MIDTVRSCCRTTAETCNPESTCQTARGTAHPGPGDVDPTTTKASKHGSKASGNAFKPVPPPAAHPAASTGTQSITQEAAAANQAT